MRIQSAQSKSYCLNSPNFKHWNRTVYKLGTSSELENVVLRNNTDIYRDPDFWIDLVRSIEKKLNNIPKINMYSYGCSDGSDPLSFVLTALAHKRDSLLKKISPIIAKDIDPVAIARAKSGVYEIVESEENTIERYTCGKFDKFFKEYKENFPLVPKANFSVNPEVTRHICYSQASVLDDFKTIEPNNSIVLLRNMLPYLTQNYGEGYYRGGDWSVQAQFLKDLYEHLGENSYIAIGGYDRYEIKGKLNKMLKEAGFEETEVYNLYRRISKEEKSKKPYIIEKALELFKKVFY